MIIFAIFGVFASLAAQACEQGHEHTSQVGGCDHGIYRIIDCHTNEEGSISPFEDHLDHWSNHRHRNDSPCSCFDTAPSDSTTTTISHSIVRLPAINLREIVSLDTCDIRIPPALAPPYRTTFTRPSFSERISQEICVFLL